MKDLEFTVLVQDKGNIHTVLTEFINGSVDTGDNINVEDVKDIVTEAILKGTEVDGRIIKIKI